MIRKRSPLRSILLALAALAVVGAALHFPAVASGQMMMDRTGTVGIRSEEERRVFAALLCTCGCPRESIATCPCGFANERRDDARAMMAKGMTAEEIKAEWVRRFGPQALEVPANAGANRLVYIAPLLAIVAMAGVAVTVLRRFRRQEEAAKRAAPADAPVAGAKADEYDAKLDDELSRDRKSVV